MAQSTANGSAARQAAGFSANSPNKDNNNEGVFVKRFHVAMNLAGACKSSKNNAGSQTNKATCSRDLATNNNKHLSAYNSLPGDDKNNCSRKQQQHRKRGALQSAASSLPASAATVKRARREHPLDAASLISRLFFG